MTNQKFVGAWPRIRRRGKRRYIFTRGVGLCGLMYLLVWEFYFVSTAMSQIKENMTGEDLSKITGYLISTGILSVVLAVAFGYFMGALLWKTKEKRYAVLSPAVRGQGTAWD